MPSGTSQDSKKPPRGLFAFPALLTAIGGVGLCVAWTTTEHFLPWVSWHSEATVFLALLVVVLSALFSKSGAPAGYRAPIPWPALPWLAVPALAALQWASGRLTFAGDVVVLALYAVLALTCLTLGFQAGSAGRDTGQADVPKILAWTLVVGGLASLGIALLQVFDLGPELHWVARMPELRRPGGNLLQPNQLATLLAMAAAAVAFLYAGATVSGGLAVFLLLVMAAGLAITESRTGFVEVAVLAAWWQWQRARIAPASARWAAPGLLVFLAVCVIAWPQLLTAADLLGTEPAHRLSAAPRLRGWEQLLEASLLHPWFGWGALEVAEAHNAVVHGHAVSQAFSYAHNLFLDLALWFGWPLALAAAGLALAWTTRRLRAEQTPATWFCLAVFLALGVHSMLEYPFAYAYFLAPCLVLLGWLEGRRGEAPWLRVGRTPLRLAAVAMAGILAWSAAEYLLIEEDFRVVRFQHLRMGTTPAGHEVPRVVLFSQLGALLNGSRIQPRPGLSAAELETLRALALRYPWQATQYRYAVALALNGQQEEASRQLTVLLRQRGEEAFAGVRAALGELALQYPQAATLNVP